jgi:hypothetical protein
LPAAKAQAKTRITLGKRSLTGLSKWRKKLRAIKSLREAILPDDCSSIGVQLRR